MEQVILDHFAIFDTKQDELWLSHCVKSVPRLERRNNIGNYKYEKEIANMSHNSILDREIYPLVALFGISPHPIIGGKDNSSLIFGSGHLYSVEDSEPLKYYRITRDKERFGYELIFLNGDLMIRRYHYNNDKVRVEFLHPVKISKQSYYGVKKTEQYFLENKKRNGYSKIWNDDGMIEEGFYQNNQNIGLWKYYESGVLIREFDFGQLQEQKLESKIDSLVNIESSNSRSFLSTVWKFCESIFPLKK